MRKHKALKQILLIGASVLMLTSVGSGISNIKGHAVTESEAYANMIRQYKVPRLPNRHFKYTKRNVNKVIKSLNNDLTQMDFDSLSTTSRKAVRIAHHKEWETKNQLIFFKGYSARRMHNDRPAVKAKNRARKRAQHNQFIKSVRVGNWYARNSKRMYRKYYKKSAMFDRGWKDAVNAVSNSGIYFTDDGNSDEIAANGFMRPRYAHNKLYKYGWILGDRYANDSFDLKSLFKDNGDYYSDMVISYNDGLNYLRKHHTKRTILLNDRNSKWSTFYVNKDM